MRHLSRRRGVSGLEKVISLTALTGLGVGIVLICWGSGGGVRWAGVIVTAACYLVVAAAVAQGLSR
jgi:hypothetical protein